MITLENFDNNVNKELLCPNSTFSIHKGCFKEIMITMSINESKKINFHCNNLIYLKNFMKLKPSKSREIIDCANKINNMNLNDRIYINENVIPFINAHSCGTGHGYCELFSTILGYLDNNQYSNYKIIVYKDSQQGILDIINHLCHINILNKNNLIFIECEKVYQFKSIYFIEDKYLDQHCETDNFVNKIRELLSKYFINKIDYLNPVNCNIDNVLIVKENNEKSNLTGNTGFELDEINEFCKNNNFQRVKPENINEVILINILKNCKNLVVSWGTAHYKSIPYLNTSYETINILIKNKGSYIGQYKKYLKIYNNYLSSNKSNKRSDVLHFFYDSPKTTFHVINNLNEINIQNV